MAFLEIGANSAADTGYNIENSCRFFSDTDLKRLPSSTGSSIKATMSVWVKFSTDDTDVAIAGGWDNSGANDDDGYWVLYRQGSTGRLLFEGGTDTYLRTNAVFRDVSAWYHIVLAIDSAQNGDTSQRLYINGVELTSFAARSNLTNLQDLPMNTTAGNDDALLIGCDEDTGGKGLHFNGYMSDFFWIDGTQYDADDFGETDSNGVWIPKTGSDIVSDLTMGTNGVFLEFKQTGTSANSSGIGADTGGNDLHFTVTNLAATDITEDTATNNFATLNPLMGGRGSTLSEGNLKVTGESDNNYDVTTFGSDMKWYMEWKVDENYDGSGGGIRLGAIHEDELAINDNFSNFANATAKFYTNSNDGKTQDGNGDNVTTGLTRATTNDIIMCACDGAGAKIWWGVNGTWLDYGSGTGDPAAGSNAAEWTTAMKAGIWFPATVYSGTAAAGTLNLGNPPNAISSSQADDAGYGNFEYDVPAGFYALCTKNLAEYG